MKQSDVIDWLHTRLSTLLAESSLVSLTASEADAHVGVADDSAITDYPFIGIDGLGSVPDTAGIGAATLVVDELLDTDDDGIIEEARLKAEHTLTVELAPVTDDDQRLRDELADAIAEDIGVAARLDATPADMTIESVGEATPADRTDEFVRAQGVPVVVSYETFTTVEVDAAESVTLDLDATDDLDASGTDAFDDTVQP